MTQKILIGVAVLLMVMVGVAQADTFTVTVSTQGCFGIGCTPSINPAPIGPPGLLTFEGTTLTKTLTFPPDHTFTGFGTFTYDDGPGNGTLTDVFTLLVTFSSPSFVTHTYTAPI